MNHDERPESASNATRYARAADRHDIRAGLGCCHDCSLPQAGARRVPEIIQSQGRRPVTRVLDDADYREALLSKLIEEAREATTPPPQSFPVSYPTSWKCSAP